MLNEVPLDEIGYVAEKLVEYVLSCQDEESLIIVHKPKTIRKAKNFLETAFRNCGYDLNFFNFKNHKINHLKLEYEKFEPFHNEYDYYPKLSNKLLVRMENSNFTTLNWFTKYIKRKL